MIKIKVAYNGELLLYCGGRCLQLQYHTIITETKNLSSSDVMVRCKKCNHHKTIKIYNKNDTN